MATKKTPLEIIQSQIDRCNNHNGCDSCCSKERQQQCEKLKAHRDRCDWCREHNISIIYW